MKIDVCSLIAHPSSAATRKSISRVAFLVGLAATSLAGCSSESETDVTASTRGSTVSAGGSSAQSSGSGGTGGSSAVLPTHLPTVTGTCPDMANLDGAVVSFAGQAATVWSGDPAAGPGPLLVYYYATGSSPVEPLATIGQAQIAAIKAMGGAVVAQNATTQQGNTTGNDVWYTGDAAIADEIVACGIDKQHIDPRHVHVAGYSAGALQTTYMWFARSGYVASVLTYSGGDVGIDKAPLQDPAHPPAALVTHGAKGSDTYGGVVDFFDASTLWENDIEDAGGFAIDCNDGGAHTDFVLRTKVAPQALQFFLDHPYGVSPEPYTTLPGTFPAYCSIVSPGG